MKLITLLLLLSTGAVASELGEDMTNSDCTRSIHRPRVTVAQIKNNIEFNEEDDADSDEGVQTIQK